MSFFNKQQSIFLILTNLKWREKTESKHLHVNGFQLMMLKYKSFSLQQFKIFYSLQIWKQFLNINAICFFSSVPWILDKRLCRNKVLSSMFGTMSKCLGLKNSHWHMEIIAKSYLTLDSLRNSIQERKKISFSWKMIPKKFASSYLN